MKVFSKITLKSPTKQNIIASKYQIFLENLVLNFKGFPASGGGRTPVYFLQFLYFDPPPPPPKKKSGYATGPILLLSEHNYRPREFQTRQKIIRLESRIFSLSKIFSCAFMPLETKFYKPMLLLSIWNWLMEWHGILTTP